MLCFLNNKNDTLIDLIKRSIFKIVKKKIQYTTYDKSFTLKWEDISVEKTKNNSFGNYSTNVAMSFRFKKKEEVINFANDIANDLSRKIFARVNVVEPGFINLTISNKFLFKVINKIVKANDNYGKFNKKKDFYNIEFVSANPTGLIHIGHARNGAYGETLAKIWENFGITVNREFYINDAGNQIKKLGLSTLIRYKQLYDVPVELPEDSYHGNEIIDVAKKIKLMCEKKYIDAAFSNEKIEDEEVSDFFSTYAKDYMLERIKETLENMGIKFDIWFSEKNIHDKSFIDSILKQLNNNIYKKDGATWLMTTKLGDDKDRVIIKSDGEYTYFLPDIIYHNIKLSRGYNKIFNIWGVDHKSYADRLTIAVILLGYKKEQINILFQQMVRLTKNGEDFKMSKRSGQSLTAEDLLNSIGKEAARWFLVSQSFDTHLEIDVEKATSNTSTNSLYYVQYAHARINQLIEKHKYENPKKFNLLTLDSEIELMCNINDFKPLLECCAKNYQVHRLITYLTNLAKNYHSYYSNTQIIDKSNPVISSQRYYLSVAVKQIIKNGLALLDIKASEKM